MLFIKLFIIFLQIFVFVNAKNYIIISEYLRNCSINHGDMELFDLSNFEMIPENDTHTFLNGTIKVKAEIKSPWIRNSHAEFYERGEWLLKGYYSNIPDFCLEFHNKFKPWYYITKNFEGCPIPAEKIWSFDMIPVELSENLTELIPHHYMGQWRLIIDTYLNVSGKTFRSCRIGYGDVFVE